MILLERNIRVTVTSKDWSDPEIDKVIDAVDGIDFDSLVRQKIAEVVSEAKLDDMIVQVED